MATHPMTAPDPFTVLAALPLAALAALGAWRGIRHLTRKEPRR